ncbi:MAG: HEAT repeat domain-containing protein, partial [Candidatus Hermodarchaeota archaeon]
MTLLPSQIYHDLKTKHLDKQSAIRFLLTLIESSENNSIRLESIKYLDMIGIESDDFYALFENLLISDISREIRIRAAQILKDKFSHKALVPIKWTIQHETDYECLITIIQTLKEIKNEESKKILVEELKKIRKKKHIDDNKNYNNKSFKRSLKNLSTKKNLSILTNAELAE